MSVESIDKRFTVGRAEASKRWIDAGGLEGTEGRIDRHRNALAGEWIERDSCIADSRPSVAEKVR